MADPDTHDQLALPSHVPFANSVERVVLLAFPKSCTMDIGRKEAHRRQYSGVKSGLRDVQGIRVVRLGREKTYRLTRNACTYVRR
jgi:hypothetical protein